LIVWSKSILPLYCVGSYFHVRDLQLGFRLWSQGAIIAWDGHQFSKALPSKFTTLSWSSKTFWRSNDRHILSTSSILYTNIGYHFPPSDY
jgi:hypothetical protein